MSIGDAFPYPAPTVGSADWANWMRVMDELITRVSSPVPLSAIEGGDLDMDGNSIINLETAIFQDQPTTPAATPGTFYYSNDTWWLVTTAGAIQINDGANLNITVNGGIGGDYGGTNPASVRFVDATNRYDFYDDFGGLAWAYARFRGIDIAGGATSSVRARINYAGAGNLTFTLPPTVPASGTSAVVISSTGAITHDAAISNDVVLTGTAKVQHGEKWFTVGIGPAVQAGLNGFGVGTNATVDGDKLTVLSNPSTYILPLQTLDVWRIKEVRVYGNKFDTSNTVVKLFASALGANVELATVTSAVAGDVTLIATVGSPSAVGAGGHLYVTILSNANNDKFYTCSVKYDVPA